MLHARLALITLIGAAGPTPTLLIFIIVGTPGKLGLHSAERLSVENRVVHHFHVVDRVHQSAYFAHHLLLAGVILD